MSHPRQHRWLFVAACALVVQSGVVPAAQGQGDPQPPDHFTRMLLPRLPGQTTPDRVAAEAPSVVTPGSRLVHQSYRDEQAEVYIANDDGTAEQRLTTSTDPDIQPDLDRGALRVAFARKSGDYEIQVMASAGGASVPLTDNAADDVAPDWSPDGTRLAFQSYRDGQAEIYSMQADGAGQTRLTNDAAYDGQPAYSPDGTQIAFVSNRSGTPALWLMNVNGTGAHVLATPPDSFDPTWSPDGAQIAFDADSNGDGWQELWIINADGTNARSLYAPGATQDAWAGSFSPDGRYIAFTHVSYINYQGTWYWTTAYLDGYTLANGAQHVLLNASDVAFNPDWQGQDTTAPAITVTALGAVSPGPIPLSWTGTDSGPAGMRDYDVQWKEGNGAWTGWLTGTTATRSDFAGLAGHSYAFRVRGRDQFFNTTAWTTSAQTTIETQPPASTLTATPFARGTISLAWSALDEGHSGVLNYDVQERLAPAGVWSDLLAGTTQTSLVVTHPAGQTYDYRVRARDRAQNLEAWPADSDAARVVFYDWQIAGALHDNAGAPLDAAQLTSTPALLGVSIGGGAYTGFGQRGAFAYPLAWSEAGYGLLPTTTITPQADTHLAIALPPLDNVLAGGQFESWGPGPSGWQTAGTLGIAAAPGHTGAASLRLGGSRPLAWAGVETVATPVGAQVGSPTLVVDSHGTAHVLWSSGTLTDTTTAIYYAWKPVAGAWSAPQRISTGENNLDPVLVIDGADALHAVWRTYAQTLFAEKLAGQAWSAPAELYGQVLAPLDAAATPDGDLVVVGGRSIVDTILLERVGSVWSATEMLAMSNPPAVALDAAGGVHVVTGDGSGTSLRYRYRSPEGVWGPVEILPAQERADHPDITVDGTGRVHVVWGDLLESVSYLTKAPGGDWSAVTTFPGSGVPYRPTLASSGDLVSVFFAYRPTPFDNYVLAERHRMGAGAWSDPVIVSPQPSVFVNGPTAFITPEGGIHAAWQRWVTAGDNAVRDVQYLGPAPAAQAGLGAVAQSVTIPVTQTAPTLGLFYQLGNVPAGAASALDVRLTDAGGQTTLLHTQATTSDWTFQSFDVSAWLGQTVTVTVALQQAANQPQAWALVDDLALGSVAPDVWVAVSDASTHRGSQVTYTLRYGNQGAPPASAVRVHVVLPAGVAFVSASVAPGGTTPDLWWEVGTLAGRSGPFTLTVTGQTATDAAVPARLTQTATITTTSPELQTPNNTASGTTTVAAHTLYLPSLRR